MVRFMHINLAGALVVLSYLPGQPIVSYTSYTPSFVEWIVGLGVIAFGFLVFSLGVRYLRVVDHHFVEKEHIPVDVKAAEAATV